MIFGFNTDVQGNDAVYHVQTEDRGHRNPIIESIIYVGGKILGKQRTPYDPTTFSKEQIEEAVRHQHKELMEAIRNGTWVPTPSAASAAANEVATAGSGVSASANTTKGYIIEMTNPDGFRQGEYFRFQLALRDRGNDSPAFDVALDVRWLVAGQVADRQTLTSRRDGGAEVWVSAPQVSQPGTLVIQAQGSHGKQVAKFNIQPMV